QPGQEFKVSQVLRRVAPFRQVEPTLQGRQGGSGYYLLELILRQGDDQLLAGIDRVRHQPVGGAQPIQIHSVQPADAPQRITGLNRMGYCHCSPSFCSMLVTGYAALSPWRQTWWRKSVPFCQTIESDDILRREQT